MAKQSQNAEGAAWAGSVQGWETQAKAKAPLESPAHASDLARACLQIIAAETTAGAHVLGGVPRQINKQTNNEANTHTNTHPYKATANNAATFFSFSARHFIFIYLAIFAAFALCPVRE